MMMGFVEIMVSTFLVPSPIDRGDTQWSVRRFRNGKASLYVVIQVHDRVARTWVLVLGLGYTGKGQACDLGVCES